MLSKKNLLVATLNMSADKRTHCWGCVFMLLKGNLLIGKEKVRGLTKGHKGPGSFVVKMRALTLKSWGPLLLWVCHLFLLQAVAHLWSLGQNNILCTDNWMWHLCYSFNIKLSTNAQLIIYLFLFKIVFFIIISRFY
jgi:hypothetical protein